MRGEGGIFGPILTDSSAPSWRLLIETAQSAGTTLSEPKEGLSFWNSWLGLVLQLTMFAIALALALAAGWALLNGALPATSGRTGYGAAIALLLPFGAAYLFLKSFKRRRFVLSQLGR